MNFNRHYVKARGLFIMLRAHDFTRDFDSLILYN